MALVRVFENENITVYRDGPHMLIRLSDKFTSVAIDGAGYIAVSEWELTDDQMKEVTIRLIGTSQTVFH